VAPRRPGAAVKLLALSERPPVFPRITAPPALTRDELAAALHRMGLAGPHDALRMTPLTGGVSSDIVRVDREGESFCVKRALARLNVAAEWRAPVERNHSEAEWLRVVQDIRPEAAPRLIAESIEHGFFVMEWLPPESNPVWKAQLADGIIDERFAEEVGRRIAAIHAATAGRSDIARRFPNDGIFHAIRLEPYLLATAERHPDLARRLRAIAERTGRTRLALVHGDVSPKNILASTHGPVFLDAECATYGDPAFDLAFCLNHLLLKAAWRPHWRQHYHNAFRALEHGYLSGVTWEPRDVFEARCAELLPALFLARVDGKSPVEYLTEETERKRVRACAAPLIAAPRLRLCEVAEAWRRATDPHRPAT
jgi:aminoglycoside phosphotransferase (APT) family kinase protein